MKSGLLGINQGNKGVASRKVPGSVWTHLPPSKGLRRVQMCCTESPFFSRSRCMRAKTHEVCNANVHEVYYWSSP